MDVDRKTVVELTVSAFVLAVFTAGTYVVSRTYAMPRNATTNSAVPPAVQPAGGLALVGTIALFILVVAVAGLLVYVLDLGEE